MRECDVFPPTAEPELRARVLQDVIAFGGPRVGWYRHCRHTGHQASCDRDDRFECCRRIDGNACGAADLVGNGGPRRDQVGSGECAVADADRGLVAGAVSRIDERSQEWPGHEGGHR
ncbi:hypothetical protein RE9425_00650 [Prescottella equi]|nr:hypothetical protein RE9425_00650 [Prescottella equi]